MANSQHPMRFESFTSLLYAGGVLWILGCSGLALGQEATPWSFSPMVRPDIPQAHDSDTWSEHPVDQFIQEALAGQGLSHSPEAPPHQLLRRLFLDVWGLPPDTDLLKELDHDNFETTWTQWVDRALAGPQYGERWARHWMDLIHYAETHGHDEDAPRENAWPYRDYLIQSLNADKPYATFALEQIAGDAMEPHDPEALIATGFLAAGPWDESSQMGIQDGTLDKELAQYLDRDDMITTVMSSFLGVSVHCARCHDHKFDPIPFEDYYALQAVFAGVDRHDRPFDKDPKLHRLRQDLLTQKEALLAERTTESALLSSINQERTQSWISERQDHLSRWKAGRPLAPPSSEIPLTPWEVLEDGSLFIQPTDSLNGKLTWSLLSPYPKPTAVELEVMADSRLPQGGPGWSDEGDFQLTEFKVYGKGKDSDDWIPILLEAPENDFSKEGTSVRYLIDDDPETHWSIFPQKGQNHRCFFRIASLPDDRDLHMLRVELNHPEEHSQWVGRCRIRWSNVPSDRIEPFLEANLQEAFACSEETRTLEQKLLLTRHALGRHLDQTLEALPTPPQVYAATSYFSSEGNFKPSLGPRTVRQLRRGSIQQPGKEAQPAALSALSHIPWNPEGADLAEEDSRRLALGKWITHPSNGLFWRTMANRLWQHHFGSPLIPTPNDLGNGGQAPTHPELLDWLACELRDSGGSLKHVHRLILHSRTYRQASTWRKQAAAQDAENTYYWRMSPRRMDAESFRDSLLQLSGQLDARMGGPSVKQFLMDPGIHVTPIVDYKGFDPTHAAMHRRSIYRFLFRTLPDPFMKALDCPDASTWHPERNRSVGSLQALAMLHDPWVIAQSQAMADQLQKVSKHLERQIELLYESSLCRMPNPTEKRLMIEYADRHGLANATRYLWNSNAFVFTP